MAFGIEAFNAAGETVLNTDNENLYVLRETVSNSSNRVGVGSLGASSERTYGDVYLHGWTKRQSRNLFFFELDPGDAVALHPVNANQFLTNKQAIRVREVCFASDLPASEMGGDGLAVWDAAGVLIYSASAPLMATRNWFEMPGSGSGFPAYGFACSDRWYALARPGFGIFGNGSQTAGPMIGRGVGRFSTSRIENADLMYDGTQIPARFVSDTTIISAL